MRPSRQENDKRLALFRERLENLLNREHELYRLAGLITRDLFEQEFGKFYTPNVGRPGTPIRLLVGLSCLGHVYGLSDEEVVAGWVKNPYWQYFCGETYFQHQLPIDPSSMTRWRQRIGEKGCELILAETLRTGLRSGAVKESTLKRLNVDTTVQPKAVRYPTDSRSYEFGVKVSVATTSRDNFVVGMQASFFFCSGKLPDSMPEYVTREIWSPAAKNGLFQDRLS